MLIFFLLLSNDVVDIRNSNGITSPTFVVDDFSELFLHQSIISIKDSRSESIINGALSDLWY